MIVSFILIRPLNYTITKYRLNGKVVDVRSNYCILKTKEGKVKAYTDESFQCGDTVDVYTVPLDINSRANDYGFDEGLYLKANNIKGKVKIVKVYDHQRHLSFTSIILSLLSKDEKAASYQKLFLLGVKDDEIKDDYTMMSNLSIIHLFALSGMHITVFYGALKQLFGWIVERHKASVIAKIFIGIYVYSIPYNISLQRAFWMLVLPDILKPYYSKQSCLCILFIYHILMNPYIIFSTGFVFSYYTYMVVLFVGKLPYSSLLIYVSTIPLLLNINGSINLVSFILSFILLDFIEYFYLLTVMSVLFVALEPVLIVVVDLFEKQLLFMSHIGVTVVFSHPNILFYGLFFYAFISLIIHMEDRRSIRHDVYMMIALMISFGIYSRYKLYADVTMINVGQGDCTLIRLPLNRGNILIDTGGNKNYDLAVSTTIPYLKAVGIDHIDVVYISHYDYDHYGALDSLQKHFKVKKVIDSYQKETKIGEMKIRMLSSGRVYSDKNDNSLVMQVTLHGWNYLFTGDLGIEGEHDLYQKYKHIDCDVLKVGHHGSAGSSSVELFEMVHPRIAMIGVGRNNLYGHPTKIVLNRLEERGIMILRTDQDGNFTIRSYGNDHYIFR